MQQLYEALHEHAEVSFEEWNTTKFLVEWFTERGFSPKPFGSIPGFTVEIGSGQPVIALRADLDALYQEVNGEMKANHSCGHDAHMTIVSHVLLALQHDVFKGTVRAIFQPAEELGSGAEEVVKLGVADDVDYLYGIHVRPKNEIEYPHCAPAIQHGACQFLTGTIRGRDHHGARPHEGVNAIELIGALQNSFSLLHTSPKVPSSIKLTHVQAGGDNLNIIPGIATFGIDARAATNEVMAELVAHTERTLDSLSALYDVPIDYEWLDPTPAAVISKEAESILRESIEHATNVPATPRLVTAGSDDFHFYTLRRPHIRATMLALGADVTPGLHAPDMTFNHDAMPLAVSILKEAVLRTSRKYVHDEQMRQKEERNDE